MYRPCSESNWLRQAAAPLALALLLGGCAAQPARHSAEAGAAATAQPQAEATRPATVEVDAGVGFTVTEAVTIDSATRARYREALQRLAADDLAAGIALLEAVVAEVPEATSPYVDLGIAYGRAQRFDDAVSTLETAVAATPDHPVAHNELGIAYRRVGRFAEARASYQAALAISPEFHFARRNLAVLCDLYLADHVCALGHYQAYRAAVPDDAEVNMWLADLQNRVAVQSGEGS